MTVHACTIIARNYLPAARVLARSFAEHHPDGSFATLVIDDVYGLVDPAAEPFEVLRLPDLDLSEAERLEMAAIYDVMELATAVKPWLLELLLDRFAPDGSVLYLDPDIKIFAPLDELDRLAGEHGIVLTPHATKPMPRDGRGTDETAILASGAYNLGFVALGPGGERPVAQELVEFWKERLRRECFVDPKKMRFVDQRWVDFVPGIFDVAIVRDPAYNVAYWNLDHRQLSIDAKRYLIDGELLRFFHFSGYTPKVPHLLSKHQGPKPRILLSDNPALRQICDEYGADLLAAGYEDAGKEAYAFRATAEGLELDQFMRRVYREALEAAEEDGEEHPPNPLDGHDGGRFLAWLNGVEGPARTESGSKMSRYLAAVYDRRPDLQAAFPEALADARRMYEWARHEAAVGRLDPRLAPEDPPPLAAGAGAPAAGELRPGIRVAGYLRAETGVGEHGRLAIEAARAAVGEVSVHVDTHTLARQHHLFFGPERDDLNVNLICVNADELPRFAARVGDGFFAGRYNIGLWAWELEHFPEKYHESFAHVDEVWANSEFTRAAIEQVASKPVYAFPLPVVQPHVPASLSDPAVVRERHGIPVDRACFYFAFDLFSIPARKNPLGLIEAFGRAFSTNEGPVLVIKAVGGDHRTEDLERLKYVASGRPDVLILDRYLDRGESAALMAACDCYTSLHRAEGFGLTMAEAMALGKPVIATAYSGNLDFMTEETSYLVPVAMGEVPPGSDPYPAGTPWAEPDLEAAAELMRRVVEHPDEAAERGRRAREHVLERHGVEVRATFIAERFAHAQDVLAARLAPPPPAAGAGGGSGAVVEIVEPPLVAMARRLPDPQTPSRYPRVARFARQAVLRALRHRDELQRELDLAMAMGIEHVAHYATVTRGDLDHLRVDVTRLREQLRVVTERLAVDERAEASRDTRTRGLLERIGHRLGALDRVDDEVLGAIAQLEKDVDEQSGELDRLGSAWRAVSEGRSPGEFARTLRRLVEMEREMHAVPYMSEPDRWVVGGPDGPAIGFEGALRSRSSYASFEEVFRGPESMVTERQARAYVPLLQNQAPVLDLGCGRGELLELLRDAGIEARGVDADRDMVRRCAEKGLDVSEADAVEALRACTDGALGAIACLQVVEHVDAGTLWALLSESARALRPGGVLIVETVNPHAVAAFKTFWTDPTHRGPIFPETLVVCCAIAGFDAARVVFPNGEGVLEVDRVRAGEYAVVARKA